ncbi:hypothetical protein WICMUC_004938 [Wickerhamomyces mucosus]|uniref:Protein-serine/threonine kinase n=1 Tax=Wickerhamomyces mucosus TaxID=1378264 RepID=A0A9P8PEW8_9ASCO|nr:hypothetical protein WICMUC_004938 [Wickerhamomyces mucosus]
MSSSQLKSQIAKFAKIPPTGISLKEMCEIGSIPSQESLYKSNKFIVNELPIRLAHRIEELDTLPNGLNKMSSIEKVKNWYTKSFEELIEINSLSTSNSSNSSSINHHIKFNRLVTDTLKTIKKRHDPTVATVAQGVLEWKNSTNQNLVNYSIQSFLDRFYMSRIGIRMLIGQNIAINEEPSRDNYVGVICKRTNLKEVAIDAIDNSRFICEEYYGIFESPEIELICPNIKGEETEKDLTFMYVPGHLMHMLFEILKNSLRATVETTIKSNPGIDLDQLKFKPIKLIIIKGLEDITIKISDEGGGIPRSEIPLVWTYLYTTIKEIPDLDPSYNKTDFRAPMAGFGYGLALSRLYARYFGGDLKLMSMEGYGTDVYLHLNRVSTTEALQ